MLTLGDLCDLVAGRVPLVIEMKSRFDGDLRLAARAAAVLARYSGSGGADVVRPGAGRRAARQRPGARPRHRGRAALFPSAEWAALPASRSFDLAHLLHAPKTRPQFVAYAVKDLPAPGPWIARNVFGLPLLTWTVRSEADRKPPHAMPTK